MNRDIKKFLRTKRFLRNRILKYFLYFLIALYGFLFLLIMFPFFLIDFCLKHLGFNKSKKIITSKAEKILGDQLKEVKNITYEELKKFIHEDDSIISVINYDDYLRKIDITVDDTEYWGDIQVFWDDKSDGNIRVMGSISYGFPSDIFPLTSSYIITPENEIL